MTFLTEMGRHRAQIVYFFRMYIGSRTPSGIGMRSGGPPDRMRRFLELPESSGSKTLGDQGQQNYGAKDHGRCILHWKRRRRRRRRLHTTRSDPERPLGDLRTTNRQVSTDAAAMVGPSISRITKLIFSAPSKCPIDIFGLLVNGAVLKRLHVTTCITKTSVSRLAPLLLLAIALAGRRRAGT